MSLRKSFDSFAPQHKLWDAEEAYVQAVYRLILSRPIHVKVIRCSS